MMLKTSLVAWLAGIQLVGIALFSGGFFLTRIELPQVSECDPTPLLRDLGLEDLWQGNGSTAAGDPEGSHARPDDVGCWTQRRFDRVVLLVIDALRYDFVERAEESHPSVSPTKKPYTNQLNTVHRIMEEQPRQSFLARFVADPPTVTMQRLKGITTGGLPTFLELRRNFDSSHITEDNWVHQMRAESDRTSEARRMVFVGDDTWAMLFPTTFHTSIPFPSFDTRDLHTVDDGVQQHIFQALEGDDWGLVIGHMLGVDHVGHTFGPNHPMLSQKLSQVDKILDAVVRTLQVQVQRGSIPPPHPQANRTERTLVLMIGDHGMTEAGNHGGASREETHSSIFAHAIGLSPPPHTHNSDHDRTQDTDGGLPLEVAQVDLVPTLSLLLGLPIPFSNLGGLVTGLADIAGPVEDSNSSEDTLSQYLMLNAAQIWRYLTQYAQVAALPPHHMESLASLLEDAVAQHRESIHHHNVTDVQQTHELYRRFLEAALDLGRKAWTRFDSSMMCHGALILALSSVLLLLQLYQLIVFGHGLVEVRWRVSVTHLCTAAFASGPVFFVLGPRVFSSSLGMAVAIVVTYAALAQSFLDILRKSPPPRIPSIGPRALIIPHLLSAAHTCSRFSNSFIEGEHLTIPFLSSSAHLWLCLGFVASEHRHQDARWRLIATAVVAAVTVRLLQGLEDLGSVDAASHASFLYTIMPAAVLLCGAGVGMRLGMLCMNPAIFGTWGAIAALEVAHWHLEAQAATPGLWIPRAIYALGVLGTVLAVALPRSRIVSGSVAARYTLAVRSMRLGLVSVSLTSVWALLLGVRGVYLASLMLMCQASIIAFWATAGRSFFLGHRRLAAAALAVSWRLTTRAFLYLSGHHNSFSSLQISSATIGFESFSFVRSGGLLFLNTFGSEIAWELLLPFALVQLALGGAGTGAGVGVGARETDRRVSPVVTTGLWAAFAAQTVDYTFSALCVTVHRRHLMVWAVFAPKFCLDTAVQVLWVIVLLGTSAYLRPWVELQEQKGARNAGEGETETENEVTETDVGVTSIGVCNGDGKLAAARRRRQQG